MIAGHEDRDKGSEGTRGQKAGSSKTCWYKLFGMRHGTRERENKTLESCVVEIAEQKEDRGFELIQLHTHSVMNT